MRGYRQNYGRLGQCRRGLWFAAALGYFIATNFGDASGARFAAIAAGGLLAMLTDSVIPFAFERGGKWAGLGTVIGFAVSYAL